MWSDVNYLQEEDEQIQWKVLVTSLDLKGIRYVSAYAQLS